MVRGLCCWWEMRKLPDVSPLRGAGACRHVAIGMEDALSDDTLLMHKKWVSLATGELGRVARGPHGVATGGGHE